MRKLQKAGEGEAEAEGEGEADNEAVELLDEEMVDETDTEGDGSATEDVEADADGATVDEADGEDTGWLTDTEMDTEPEGDGAADEVCDALEEATLVDGAPVSVGAGDEIDSDGAVEKTEDEDKGTEVVSTTAELDVNRCVDDGNRLDVGVGVNMTGSFSAQTFGRTNWEKKDDSLMASRSEICQTVSLGPPIVASSARCPGSVPSMATGTIRVATCRSLFAAVVTTEGSSRDWPSVRTTTTALPPR